MKFQQNFVYRTMDNDLFLSVHSGDYYVSDCYPLTSAYQVKKGFEYPIPVRHEDIKETLGDIEILLDSRF